MWLNSSKFKSLFYSIKVNVWTSDGRGTYLTCPTSPSYKRRTACSWGRHRRAAPLYLDFRGEEFVCPPLWGVLVLLTEIDCRHLALLQEGQQNEAIAQHGCKRHHRICHWKMWAYKVQSRYIDNDWSINMKAGDFPGAKFKQDNRSSVF